MKVSVIITAHNEKRDLEVTATLAAYGSTRPYEIIVVDDFSDEPAGDRLDHIERCRTIRTPEQLGVAASRNFGAAQASGDILIFLDSHMRMTDWWLDAILDAAKHHPSAVMCPSCVGFSKGWDSEMHCCGATFHVPGTRFLPKDPSGLDPNKVGIEPRWLDHDTKSGPSIVPCIMGACYIVPRFIWDRLGGFNPNFHGWGQDEQDISIRTWMLGYECRGIHRVNVAHRWNRNLPGDFMNTWQPGFNSVVNCATLMPTEMFNRYLPTLKKHYSNSKVWHRFYQRENEIMAYREQVQSGRVRSDAQIEQIIGQFYPKGAM